MLSYEPEELSALRRRLSDASSPVFQGTRFSWSDLSASSIAVTCPWGNVFEARTVAGGRDPRGEQPGPRSSPCGMPELLIHVDADADISGIARFYGELVGARVELRGGRGKDAEAVAVACGSMQELIFCRRPHGLPSTASDYHVSMYVDDFQGIFRSACLPLALKTAMRWTGTNELLRLPMLESASRIAEWVVRPRRRQTNGRAWARLCQPSLQGYARGAVSHVQGVVRLCPLMQGWAHGTSGAALGRRCGVSLRTSRLSPPHTVTLIRAAVRRVSGGLRRWRRPWTSACSECATSSTPPRRDAARYCRYHSDTNF